MRTIGWIAGLAMALSWGQAQAARPAKASEACGRTCLERLLDSYVAGLAARDPAAVPLASDAKLTENGVVSTTGKGVWRTASGFGDYRIVLSDEESGQAAFVGDLKEGAASTMFALRIKVTGRRISEAEMIVGRAAIPGPSVLPAARVNLAAAKIDATLAPRAGMISTTTRYLDAIVTPGPGEIFAPDCERVENRKQMTGNPAMGSIGCNFHFDTFDGADPRRIVVVDRARQLVFGVFMLNWYGRPGCSRAGGKPCPAPTGLL
ncbi:MAG: hypothetical protein ABIO37_09805, partial [Caulobacteraceae bacterium]